MKHLINKLILSTAAVAVSGICTSIRADERPLPSPDFGGGMPVNEVFMLRQSERSFDPAKDIDDATLSQLLWMTVGVNRPDAPSVKIGQAPANRTNPTALNRQEVRVFVFGKQGVWEYIAAEHSLRLIADTDARALVAGTPDHPQDFVKDAPYSILFVADMENLPQNAQTENMSMVDVGIACENLNIACASMGVATVPRATMDTAGIARLLGLTPRQIPVMNNPIGYSK